MDKKDIINENDKYALLRGYFGEYLASIARYSDEEVKFVADLRTGISPNEAKRKLESFSNKITIYNWPHEEILKKPKRMLGYTNQNTYEALFKTELCLVSYCMPLFRGAKTKETRNSWFAEKEAAVPESLNDLISGIFLNSFPFGGYFGDK